MPWKRNIGHYQGSVAKKCRSASVGRLELQEALPLTHLLKRYVFLPFPVHVPSPTTNLVNSVVWTDTTASARICIIAKLRAFDSHSHSCRTCFHITTFCAQGLLKAVTARIHRKAIAASSDKLKFTQRGLEHHRRDWGWASPVN